MKTKTVLKVLTLAALLALCLLLTGCYIPPDEITDGTENLTIGSNNLPFNTLAPTETATPSPTPNAGNVGGSTGQTGNDTLTVVTTAPTGSVTFNWDDWGSTATPGTGGSTGTATATPGTGGSITVVTAAPTATPKVTATATSSSLRQGSTGTQVRMLQQRLKDLGYYSGSVDGDFGSGTVAAVKAFQSSNGLTSDGVAGTRTLDKLYSDNAVSASSSGYTPATATPRVTATAKPTATPNLSNARYLTIGSSGTDVKQLQNRLISLGWMSGAADGSFGGATQYAVKAFQKKMGIWNDGIAGPDTQTKLYASNASSTSTPVSSIGESLKEGMDSSAVRALQKRLSSLGYYSGSVDGSFGAGTKTAVTAFQSTSGLKADGVAGTATLNALYAEDALSAGSSSSGGTGGTSSDTTDGTVSSTGYITLREGDKSDAVRKLQEALKNLGYYSGVVDGSYGSGTVTAVTTFQSMNNLTPDGVAGPATQRLLYGTSSSITYSTLREYDEGSAVTNLQYTLYELGYYDGKINGTYGTTTSDAVRAFQINNGLTPVDGIAGNKTLQTLYSASAKAATAANTTYNTLRSGDRGDEVVQLQDVLKRLGYLTSDVTGEYDDATVSAVKTFQQYNGLTTDGIAGATTQQVLYSSSAKSYP